MLKKIVFVSILLLASCATIEREAPLYERYIEYSKLVESERFDEISENYISVENMEKLKSVDQSLESYFSILIGVPGTLTDKVSHHKRIVSRNRGCLTLNGFDKSGEPTSVHVEYLKEKGSWRINHVEIAYLESEREFSTSGHCPEKPEQYSGVFE